MRALRRAVKTMLKMKGKVQCLFYMNPAKQPSTQFVEIMNNSHLMDSLFNQDHPGELVPQNLT